MLWFFAILATLAPPSEGVAIPPPASNQLLDVVFQPIVGTGEFVQHQVDNAFGQIQSGFDLIHDPHHGSRICNQAGPNQHGVCLLGLECSAVNGVSLGASGCSFQSPLNTCCRFERTCGQQESQPVTYFAGSSNGSALGGGGTCDFVVKSRPGVCQLRVDFLELNMTLPDATTGICDPNNSLQIINPSSGAPNMTFCGMNSGNHVYLPVVGPAGQLVTFRVIKASTEFEGWNIRITQVDCSHNSVDEGLRAPDGCLQYFSDRRGPLASFNFDAVSPIQADQDYNICFKSNASACALVLKSYIFQLPSSPACASGSVLVDGPLPCCTSPDSYIAVTEPHALNGTSLRRGRFCGTQFGDTAGNITVTTRKPFNVQVKVGRHVATAGNVGFLMAYELLPQCH